MKTKPKSTHHDKKKFPAGLYRITFYSEPFSLVKVSDGERSHHEIRITGPFTISTLYSGSRDQKQRRRNRQTKRKKSLPDFTNSLESTLSGATIHRVLRDKRRGVRVKTFDMVGAAFLEPL